MAWDMEGEQGNRGLQKPKYHTYKGMHSLGLCGENSPKEDFSEKFDHKVLIKGILDDAVM